MTVHPAAAPEPALKYELLPPYQQQTPGNAAPLYLMGFMPMHLETDDRRTLDQLLDASAEKFSVPDGARRQTSRQVV